MTTKIFSLLLVATVFITQAPAAMAQRSFHDWSAVQSIPTDERLIVKQKDGKTIEGEMIEASDTSLTLSRDKKVVGISRDSIREIHRSKGRSAKGKWALIGTGIGAAAGTGIGAAKAGSVSDDGGIYVLAGFVIGAGVGAATGALFGASRRQRELIYTAP